MYTYSKVTLNDIDKVTLNDIGKVILNYIGEVTLSMVLKTGLSIDTVDTISHEHLSMSKVCARWVTRMLTPKMKKTRAMTSTTLFTTYNADPELFYSRMVIMGYGCGRWGVGSLPRI